MRHLLFIAPAFLFSTIISLASPVQNLRVNGDWYCTTHDFLVNVYSSRDGIEVTRRDINETYYYDRRDDRTYLDRFGNGYYFMSDERMEFRKGDGRQVLRFSRQARNSEDWDDDYFEDRRWRNSDRSARLLEGPWYQYRNGRQMNIDRRRENIRVYYRGHRRTFRPTRSGLFIDNFGNRIVLRSANELLYYNRNHRRPILFQRPEVRVRRNRYGCR